MTTTTKARVYVFQTTIGWNTSDDFTNYMGGDSGEEEVEQRAENLREAVEKLQERLARNGAWLISIDRLGCRGRERTFKRWQFR